MVSKLIGILGREHLPCTYEMCRVVDVAVGPELVLDVLVAQHAHLLRQVLAVGAEEAPVQRYWRQQGEGLGPEAVAAAGGGC